MLLLDEGSRVRYPNRRLRKGWEQFARSMSANVLNKLAVADLAAVAGHALTVDLENATGRLSGLHSRPALPLPPLDGVGGCQ